MKTVVGVLAFMLMVFLNHVELTRPHKEDAVHPSPIQLTIPYFEGVIPSPRDLRRGIWYVGTDKEMGQEYIIGVIMGRQLYPITGPEEDPKSYCRRVKVRIDGNIANVTVPISKEDPLNKLFYKAFGPQNIRAVEIPE